MNRFLYVTLFVFAAIICGCSPRSKYTVAGKTYRATSYDPRELELYEIRFGAYNKYGPQSVTYFGEDGTYTQEDDLILIRVRNDIACHIKGNKLLIGTEVYYDIDNPYSH